MRPASLESSRPIGVREAAAKRVPTWRRALPYAVISVVVAAAVVGWYYIGGRDDEETPTPSPAIAESVISEFASGEGGRTIVGEGFRADFPANPTRTEQRAEIPGTSDRPLIVSYVVSADGPQVFAVVVADYAANAELASPDDQLNDQVEALAAQIAGTTQNTDATTLNGVPAITYLIQYQGGYATGVYALDDRRLFQAQILFTTAEPPGLERFIRSFELTG